MAWFMFFIVAAIMLAVAIVVVPLVYRVEKNNAVNENLPVLADGMRELDAELAQGLLSRDEYEQASRDLRASVLESEAHEPALARSSAPPSWAAALAVGVALPLAAIALYMASGQPNAVFSSQVQSNSGDGPIMAPIKALAKKLEHNDSDAQGWLLLARSYQGAGRIAEALSAYATTVAITPDDADLLVEYANALGRQNNRNLAGKPTQLIERALAIDPDNFNALALGGAAALQSGHSEKALKYWRHLESLIPVDSPDRTRVQALLARAQGKPVPTAVQAVSTSPPADGQRSIKGTIVVASELAGKISPSDTLFVFARAPNGPAMPIAVVRKPAAGWPVSFTLDDSRAMIQGMALSSFQHIDIVARVSQVGNASPQPGDLEGTIKHVALGSQDVKVVLDRVLDAN